MAGSPNASRTTHRRTRFTIILFFLLTLIPLRAADQSLEYQVKAAFLLNFTKFIEWPPEPDVTATPSAICILGDDPFGPVLAQTVNGETLQGRRLEVMRVHRTVPAACKVLFISRSEKEIAGILESLDPGILTVGEDGGFLQAGGIVDFVVENHRVRFDISQSAAAKAKLRVSSKLLNVARTVEK
jgi:hypothetical protein